MIRYLAGDPAVDSMVKTILKQSPKITQIKEMENKKKLTKEQLIKIIREELGSTNKTEKKKCLLSQHFKN